jgi:Zn-dependent peptidase ImmA (M78 family)/DNA-binding XRE family transcriptional regulator
MLEQNPASAESIGLRLRQVRERLGLTQAEVGRVAAIGISSISEFESGKREPTLSQLKRLANSLATDISELISQGTLSVNVVRWRQRPTGADLVEARFIKLCRQYRQLERWADEEQPQKLGRADKFPCTTREADQLARRVRHEMELGDRPGLVLRKKLEDDWGLKAFCMAIEPSGTAACTFDVEFGSAVLLNAHNSLARRTFDLAHELFHLLTWELTVPASASGKEESLADRFAAALLLPEESLRQAVERRVKNGRISTANLCELARDFRVSIDALLWRLHNLYKWQDADRTREIIARARSLLAAYLDFTADTGEDAPELPERYRNLAVQALRSGGISTGRFAEYMGIRRWQAMKYAQEAQGDETIALPDF